MDFYPYITLLLIAWALSIYRWQILSKADRWICLLLFATVVQECAAKYFEVLYRNNFYTYHVYTPVELLLVSMYFDRSLGFKKPYRFGLAVATGGLILSLINTIFFQPINTLNSYFLLFEGCTIIGLCLLSFYRLLIREDVVPSKMAHFWITLCFLFYSSLTYANLGLYAEIIGHESRFTEIFTWSLLGANFLFYFGIALVFFRYKKLIPSGE